jgi:hypothetical protein
MRTVRACRVHSDFGGACVPLAPCARRLLLGQRAPVGDSRTSACVVVSSMHSIGILNAHPCIASALSTCGWTCARGVHINFGERVRAQPCDRRALLLGAIPRAARMRSACVATAWHALRLMRALGT